MYKTLRTAGSERLITTVISVVLLLGLVYMFSGRWGELQFSFDDWPQGGISYLLIIGALAPANLLIEGFRWHTLLGRISPGKRVAFLQVIAGLCAGFITPNRVGDFAGRLYQTPKSKIRKAGAMAISGSALQGGVTLIFGLLGLLSFPYLISKWFEVPSTRLGMAGFVVFMLLLAIGLLVATKTSPLLKRRVCKVISRLPYRILTLALALSVLRYLIFSTQFVLAVYLTGYEGVWWQCYLGVFLLYFCQTFIPGTMLGELGVRESLAVAIFGAFAAAPLLPALSAMLVWIVNIALPVLVGSLYFACRRRF